MPNGRDPSRDERESPGREAVADADARLLDGVDDRARLGPDDGRFEIRRIFRLAVRTLPYLRPYLRELRPLLLVFVPLFIVMLPATMLATDLFLTRMLGGESLTPTQAWLLRLDPGVFVEPDRLSVAARQLLRGRLVRDIGLVTLVMLPVSLWVIWVVVRIRQRINQRLRVEMMEQVEAMSMRFHNEARIGDSVYRTFQDSAMVTNLMGLLVRPIGPIVTATIGIFVAFLFDWRLSLGLVACYLAAIVLAHRFTGELRAAFREAREKNSALTSRIQETLAGIRVVKAYGAERYEQRRFEAASKGAFAGAYRARTHLALFGILMFALCALPTLAASAYLAVLAGEGNALTAGFALAFVGFATWNLGAYADSTRRMGSYARSTRMLAAMWGQAQDMVVGMDRAFRQVDLAPEVSDAQDAVDFPGFRTSVAFRGVTFGYQPAHPVLEDVDLEARIGTITAVVGPTGSGKSTLGALLLRLFDPDAGRIEIDGIDLRAIKLDRLRANVSIALQENLLFGTSIEENIRYAQEDASDEAVRAAARVAGAEAFILEQPDGYQTMLGERGAKLSTGQRQRLSIARAIVKDTPILILDEPTASLDAESEMQVMENLGRWGRGRAIFLVTHRLSTIRRADQIVYLRDGRIVEAGTHAQLMAQGGGAYRRFVELESSPG